MANDDDPIATLRCFVLGHDPATPDRVGAYLARSTVAACLALAELERRARIEERKLEWLKVHSGRFVFESDGRVCLFRGHRAYLDGTYDGSGHDLESALSAAGAP